MAILRIVKRTGDVVPFDRGRIHAAIAKAVRAVGAAGDVGRVDAITASVVAEAETRFAEVLPTVEQIQDLVEKALVRGGLYEVAKAYILYRADRQRERDAARADLADRGCRPWRRRRSSARWSWRPRRSSSAIPPTASPRRGCSSTP